MLLRERFGCFCSPQSNELHDAEYCDCVGAHDRKSLQRSRKFSALGNAFRISFLASSLTGQRLANNLNLSE